MHNKLSVPILIADDDLEDCDLIRDALKESRVSNDLHFVHDGVQLLEYLRNQSEYSDVKKNPIPGLILLDLNMPKKNGREALVEIKADPKLRHIPIVLLTTSREEEDVYRSYDLGVNSYISKPVSFESLVELMKDIGHYWFEIVSLPAKRD